MSHIGCIKGVKSAYIVCDAARNEPAFSAFDYIKPDWDMLSIHARNLCLLILLNFEENISTGNFVALSKQLNTGETSRYGSEFSVISIAVEQLM
jgi:hypothetical protein